MIAPSPSVAPDDVSIRCKVRRSPFALNPEFDQMQDMTCTMKNWNANSISVGAMSSIGSIVTGRHEKKPELLLCPIHLPSSYNKNDFSSSSLSSSARSAFSLLPPTASMKPTDERTAAMAVGLSQRFHSFGSTPLVTNNNNPALSSSDHGRDAKTSNNLIPSLVRRQTSRGTSSVNQERPISPRSTPTAEIRKTLGRRLNGAMGQMKTHGSANRSRSTGLTKKRISNHDKSNNYSDNSNGSNNNGSGGSSVCSSSILHDFACLKSCVVPISDIIVVDVDGPHSSPSSSSSSHPNRINNVEVHETNIMNVTTVVNGYFEFTFDSKNAHDIMLAFLQSCLPPERITNGGTLACQQKRRNASFATNESVRSEDVQSFDVDRFTAKEIKGWVEHEPLTDKLSRRIRLAASRIGEFTLSISECVCGDNNSIGSNSHYKMPHSPTVQVFAAASPPTTAYTNHRIRSHSKRYAFDEADAFRRTGSGPTYIFSYEDDINNSSGGSPHRDEHKYSEDVNNKFMDHGFDQGLLYTNDSSWSLTNNGAKARQQ